MLHLPSRRPVAFLHLSFTFREGTEKVCDNAGKRHPYHLVCLLNWAKRQQDMSPPKLADCPTCGTMMSDRLLHEVLVYCNCKYYKALSSRHSVRGAARAVLRGGHPSQAFGDPPREFKCKIFIFQDVLRRRSPMNCTVVAPSRSSSLSSSRSPSEGRSLFHTAVVSLLSPFPCFPLPYPIV